MKRVAIFIVLTLAACGGPRQPPADPSKAVYLPFEGELQNLGSAALTARTDGGKPRFRNGSTGKALFAPGDGSSIEYQAKGKIDLGDTISISFDFNRAGGNSPSGRGGGSVMTIADIQGQDPNRIHHIAFDISKDDTPYFEVAFDDAGGNKHRLHVNSGGLPQGWASVELKIDRSKGETALFLDGARAASAKTVLAAIDSGVDAVKLGTWYKTNQASRLYR